MRVLIREAEMLTKRRRDILNLAVAEYISRGVPVASEAIARHGLGISPATIRNEMMELEAEGYLAQPHTSAGRVPTDRGYRQYIECLRDGIALSEVEQLLIYHQFHQVEREIEEWTRLAAAILARMLRNVAIVTLPKSRQCRLHHLELVALQETLVLLILILREAKLKQQMLVLDEAVSDDELEAAARRLNSAFLGLTASQIGRKKLQLTPLEGAATKAVVQMMRAEEEDEYEEPHVDGLRHILAHPELAASSKVAAVVELLEQKSLLRALLPTLVAGGGVQVVIGTENTQDVMRECSLVFSRYGIPGEVGGALGVVGPTRMQYDVAIPAVGFVSNIMSELVCEYYG